MAKRRAKKNNTVIAESKKALEVFNTSRQINSDLLSRNQLAARAALSFNGNRNLYEVLGYDPNLRFQDFLAKYTRQDITKRIVNAYPEATWRDDPIVSDNEDTDTESQFQKEWDSLTERLKVYHYFNRLDILQSLGQYAVLFIGTKNNGGGEKELALPITDSVRTIDDILFLTPFSQEHATISKYQMDMANERFGLPDVYTLTTGGQGGTESNSAMPQSTFTVHHSRVIHVAEGLLENDVFGLPLLEPIMNRLNDLEKVIGGSAETFWLNARAGMNFNSDPKIDLSPADAKKLTDEIDEYQHQLRRVIKTQGMDVKMLETAVASPKEHVSAILDLIAGTTGIPKRILIGSERGELASSQDENNWINRVEERQANFAEPMILRQFIDRLIDIKALPQPTEGEYEVKWENMKVQSEIEKADIAVKKAQAIAAYTGITGQPELVIPVEQFVVDVLQMDFKEEDIKEAKIEEDLEKDLEVDLNVPAPQTIID